VPRKSLPSKKTSDEEWGNFVAISNQRWTLQEREQNRILFTAVHKFAQDGVSDEIIRIPLRKDDLDSFGPDQWISSPAVDCLVYLHMHRLEGLVYPLGCGFYSEISSAYGKFVDGEELPEETTGAFDWLAHRFILLPITGEDHYSFVIIEHPRHPDRTIFYHVNSYRGLHASADVFAVLTWFIAAERKKKKKTMETVSSDPQSFSYLTKPRQSNDQDCGVYMLRYMGKVASFVTQNKPATLLDSIEGLVNGKFSASHTRRKRAQLLEALQADAVKEHVVE